MRNDSYSSFQRTGLGYLADQGAGFPIRRDLCLFPDISGEEAYHAWVLTPSATFVAVDEKNHILGTYYF